MLFSETYLFTLSNRFFEAFNPIVQPGIAMNLKSENNDSGIVLG